MAEAERYPEPSLLPLALLSEGAYLASGTERVSLAKKVTLQAFKIKRMKAMFMWVIPVLPFL